MSQKWRRPMVTGAAAALVAVAASTVVTGQVALPSAQPEPRTDKPKPALKVKVREPAVAGLFYPKEEAALSKMLGEFLDAAPANSIVNLKALISHRLSVWADRGLCLPVAAGTGVPDGDRPGAKSLCFV